MQPEDDVVNGYEDIFNIKSHRILKDTSVLSPDYLPSKLIGRKKEIQELAKMFSPLDYKGYPFNFFIFGKSGSGKTVVTKFFLQMLMRRLEVEKVLDHQLKWVYIQCKNISGENGVLYSIIKQIDPDTNIPKKGFAMGYYYSALYRIIKEKNLSLVVVLDEIDYLKGDGILYNFSRAGESHEIPDHHFISLIGISNSLSFGTTLDSRVQSSMQPKDVVFPPYNAEQIRAILCDRAKLAFYDGAISNDTIELCAAISARVHGDARKAIELLKSAAIYAEENGLTEVLPEHVGIADDDNDLDRILTLVSDLPLHDKLVLFAILKNLNYNKQITNASDVTKTYNKLCEFISEKPRHRTTVANKFGELETIGIIKEGKMKKGRGGSGREIILAVTSSKSLEYVLFQDDRFEDLKDFQMGFFN